MSVSKKKLFIISASIITIETFLFSHLKILNKFFDITIISNLFGGSKNIPKIKKYHINFARKINLINDLVSFFKLLIYQIINKPQVVWTISPKAGILGMLSSYILNVNYRIHIFTGQVWSNKSGFYRFILKSFDKIISLLSNFTLCDGYSQKKFLLKNNFKNSISVLGAGSICGVDTKVFKPSLKNRIKFRKKLQISNKEILIAYVGRLNTEKGIPNLINFLIQNKYKKIKLLLIGFDEEKIFEKYFNLIDDLSNIFFINYNNNVQKYLQAADIFCMPSEREGFGISVAEAMACEVPIAGSNIYGLRDLLINNYNSLTFAPNNFIQMRNSIFRLVKDKKLRKKLGKNGRKHIKKYYTREKIINSYVNFFKTIK